MNLAGGGPLVFVLPEANDAPSGGNVYNRQLTRALAERGPLHLTELDGAVRWLAEGRPGTYFFDTLDLERLAALPPRAPEQRIALVVHHLPSLEPDLPESHPSREAESVVLPRFDLYLATSDWTRELLCGRGIAIGSILVVPPAVPRLSDAARAYRPPLAALMVANLVPRKDVLGFLAALGDLAAAAPYTLRIVGRANIEPAYAEVCQRAIASSERLRGAVRLEGALAYERMDDLYRASYLLVSASKIETFGMALQEARAHGLPILARDGGNVSRHFPRGEGGRIFASPAELARELVALAGDARRMQDFFERAQRSRLSSDYDWSAAARCFERELERADVSARSRSPSADP